MSDIMPVSAKGLQSVEQTKVIAEVQAMVTVAKQFPRDEELVISKIVKACRRPTLAKVATYVVPRGKEDVTGPSIRIAEAIAGAWTNFEYGFKVISVDPDEAGVPVSSCIAFAWDYETNVRKTVPFNVRHWRHTKQGGYLLTDDQQIYELIAATAAKRQRNAILSVIPGDIVDIAMATCAETQANDLAKDFQKNLERTVAAFEKMFKVSKDRIEAKFKKTLAQFTTEDLATLNNIGASIREGVAQVEDSFPSDSPKPVDVPKQPTPPSAPAEDVIPPVEGEEAPPPPAPQAEEAPPVDEPVIAQDFSWVPDSIEGCDSMVDLDDMRDVVEKDAPDDVKAELLPLFDAKAKALKKSK